MTSAGGWPARVPLPGGELRALTRADAAALAAEMDDPELASWLPEPPAEAPARAAALLEQFEADARAGRLAALASLGEDGLDGLIVAWSDEDPAVAEVAYWVSPRRRGRGLATAMLRAFAPAVLDRGAVERLWLEIEPGHGASRRVAEHAGFRLEGVLRSHCRSRLTGRRHDCAIYSLLPGDRAQR